jgi:anaerobic magnesium-protoporphyrin IX monomethyl ester cyclase
MSVDVLFGQAYFLRFDPKLWAAQQPYAPLGTLYAAACARERGYHVAFFDAMLATAESEWASALDEHRPRVAVLFEDSFNYLTKMCLLRMRQAALTMIDAARQRGIRVAVAGSDASDHPELYLQRGADVVIVGEGEATLVDVLDVWSGRRTDALSSIPGVCWSDPHRGITRSARRDVIRDLDALPRPAWDLVNVERYRSIWRRHHGYFSMNLSTTRGCPYHCNWCAKPIYGQRYAARSPQSVVSEVAWLKETYRPDHLWISDDIFGLKPGWIEAFAQGVVARNARIPYKALLRADGVSEAVADALAASGCRIAWIGAESGSQRVLDAMEKGIRVDQIADATRRLRARGIGVAFFLQFGYPGEAFEDIQRTLEMLQACRPDDIGVSVSYPLPGTAFYERVKAQLGQKQNWVDSDDLAMMYRSTYPPEFYRVLHRLVHAEFRSLRARQTLRRLAAHPSGLNGRTMRELAGATIQRVRLPWLHRRLDRLAMAATPAQAPVLIPVLNRQAAAIPSEQPR